VEKGAHKYTPPSHIMRSGLFYPFNTKCQGGKQTGDCFSFSGWGGR